MASSGDTSHFVVNADLCFPVVLGAPSDALNVSIALFDCTLALGADAVAAVPPSAAPAIADSGLFSLHSGQRVRAMPDPRIGAGQFTLSFTRPTATMAATVANANTGAASSAAAASVVPEPAAAHALSVEVRRVPLLGAIGGKIGTMGSVLLSLVPWAPSHVTEAELARNAEERQATTTKRSWFASALGLGDGSGDGANAGDDATTAAADDAFMRSIANRLCLSASALEAADEGAAARCVVPFLILFAPFVVSPSVDLISCPLFFPHSHLHLLRGQLWCRFDAPHGRTAL